jgi:hypothetical protein
MPTNTATWTNIDPSTSDAAGIAYNRMWLLCREDPFVQMLSKQVIEALLAALFSPAGLATDDDHLAVESTEQIAPLVANVFATSPLMLVNDKFVAHVATVAAKAIFPQG